MLQGDTCCKFSSASSYFKITTTCNFAKQHLNLQATYIVVCVVVVLVYIEKSVLYSASHIHNPSASSSSIEHSAVLE